MRRLRFAPQAKRDLFDIGDWIAADRPLAARQVVSRLIERTSALREAPEMGPFYTVYGEGVRGLAVRPYLILYRVAEEGIFIERVIHGARLPKTIT